MLPIKKELDKATIMEKVYTVTITVPDGKMLKEDAIETILTKALGEDIPVDVQEIH